MRPAGLKAFEARAEERSAVYSHEQKKDITLDEAEERQFREHPKAWDYFQGQTASYRKAAIWWVVSAKKEETRKKRLASLIEDSEQGRTIPLLTRRKG
ncbi:YdeI/OmpD-associated family protein [Paenibacillus sp. P26]|nr:YdeI/OmpD-associated family protein [Paenibacillus sp. P26]UUZ96352.1 YdeI/OmpD-associated family protein [Paenibacillus sp. P25]